MKNSSRIACFLVFFGAFSTRAVADDPANDAYEKARASHKALKAMSAKDLGFSHNWNNTIKLFEAVATKHPKSAVADDALYMSGTLYSELFSRSRLDMDLLKAIGAFKSCAAKFPTSKLADDCLVGQAKAYHALKKHDDEVRVLQRVVSEYAAEDMVAEARAMLAKEGETPVIAAATPKPEMTPTATPAVSVAPKLTTGGEAQDESQRVTDVKVWSNEGYTRVGIYLGGKAKWTANDLKADGDKPPRVYIDFTRAHIGEDFKKAQTKVGNDWEVKIGDGLLQRARVNQFSSDTVRVVLDVATMEKYEVVTFDDPFRVLIDVTGTTSTAATVVAGAPATTLKTDDLGTSDLAKLDARLRELEKKSGAEPAATPSSPATPDEIQKRIKELEKQGIEISIAQQLGIKATRIYVDAGHGGHDSGAIGPGGVKEKDIALQIARKVKEKLGTKGYDAVLTRRDDTFLELEERSGIANGGKGDLFVSIHCNSKDPKSKHNPSGVETYFANLPKDDASARLAAIENKTTTQTMSGLEGVILDMLRNEYTDHSASLARTVQRSLFATSKKQNSATKDLGVKQALFYVLLTARMPAILVETAFISNAADEKRLKDPKYQDALAESIAEGIDSYFSEHGMKASAPTPKPTPVKIASDADEKKER